MSKKALLVGCNYTSIPSIRLQGCINDVQNMSEVLTDAFDYDLNNIMILRDDGNNSNTLPTRANILNNLINLVNQSGSLKEIWFHYSGHGSQIKDTNGDEADGLDEVIVPIDYQKAGFIIDDEIFNIVKNSKCKTILLFDSCHSASVCDLQWSYQFQNGSIVKSINSNKTIANTNVFCFSGCKDNQTSADAYSNEQKRGVGAFTDAFIHSLKINHFNVDILKLYTDLYAYIISEGFTQTPAFSSSSENPYYIFARETNTTVSNQNILIVDTTKSTNTNTTTLKKDLPSILSLKSFISYTNNSTKIPQQNEINFIFSMNKYTSNGIMKRMF